MAGPLPKLNQVFPPFEQWRSSRQQSHQQRKPWRTRPLQQQQGDSHLGLVSSKEVIYGCSESREQWETKIRHDPTQRHRESFWKELSNLMTSHYPWSIMVSRTPMKGQFSPSSFVNSMPAHSQRKYDIWINLNNEETYSKSFSLGERPLEMQSADLEKS